MNHCGSSYSLYKGAMACHWGTGSGGERRADDKYLTNELKAGERVTSSP
jgi:hypothetical protein